MSHEYRNQLDIKNNEKINELLIDMPIFIEDFHTHLVSKNCSTNTILGYFYEINMFLRFMKTILRKKSIMEIEATDLDKINTITVEKYLAKSENGLDLSASAKRRKLSVIKHLYNYYFTAHIINTNPVINVTGAKLNSHEVITLSDAQVKSLLHCIRNQEGISAHSRKYNERLVARDTAIMMVLLGTGMRISELIGLNISDFDLSDTERPCFHIVRKGGDDDIVYFVKPVHDAVADYIETRPLLNPGEKENALFIGTTGKRLTPDAVQKMLKKYCEAAKLPDNISPHKARATFASTVYKNTKDLYAVRDALHHKSIETSRHYISDKKERMEMAANAAQSLFVDDK